MIPRKCFAYSLLLFLVTSPCLLAAVSWWNEAWSYRQHIRINASSVSEDLHDFPLRVRLTDAQFARALAAGSGRDLRAVGADGRLLDLEVVSWKPDDVRFNVRIPKIEAGAASQGFDLYFGNPQAGPAPAGKIWPASSLAILHLAGDRKDASGRADTVDKTGYVVQNGWTDGLIMDRTCPWITLNRSQRGYLSLKPEPAQAAGPSLTFVCRFLPAKEEQQAEMIQLSGNPADGRSGLLTLCSGDGFDFAVWSDTAVLQTGGPALVLRGVKTDQWQSGVFSYDAASGVRTICVDGKIIVRDTVPPAALKTTRLQFGRGVSDSKETQFSGDLEDVRLMNGAASEAWIKATALNLSDANPLVVPGDLRKIGDTAASPPPPHLLGPTDGSHSHRPEGIKLRWLPATGASAYQVLVFKDPQGRQQLAAIDAGAATEIGLTASQARETDIYWTIAAKSAHGETRSRQLYRLSFHDEKTPGRILSPDQAVAPHFTKPAHLEIELQGYLKGRMDRLAQYMIDFTRQSPGLMRMQHQRPEKGPPPWAGVFAGQYLSSAQLMWRLAPTPELKAHIDDYARELIGTQRADGYLGPFEAMNGSLELWNHYATLCGLMDYYDDTGYAPALAAARKVVDLVIKTYGPAGETLPKTGGASESISHAVVRVYGATRDQRYLDFANYIIHQVWNEAGGVAYYKLGQDRAPVSQFPVRRWEGVHNLMTLSELYWLSGDPSYRNAFEHLWRTLRQTERHTTGGFSTNEGLLGTPFNKGTIETCCTVAWALLSTDMLRLAGDSTVADELEWSTLNSALGSIPYDGTCSTYGTQPDGYRKFCQLARQGPRDGVALSCCSTNAARGLGNIANWALLRGKDGLALNYYGPSKISADLESGNRLSLTQTTRYPAQGDIHLDVSVQKPETFTLLFRIPSWSKQTRVLVNGQALPAPQPGSYLPIRRQWNTGDTVALSLDFTPRFQTGAEDYAGKISVFQGPILFASDARYDANQDKAHLTLDPKGLTITPIEPPAGEGPWILARMVDGTGRHLTVCDFSSAGLFGDKYASWFDLKK